MHAIRTWFYAVCGSLDALPFCSIPLLALPFWPEVKMCTSVKPRVSATRHCAIFQESKASSSKQTRNQVSLSDPTPDHWMDEYEGVEVAARPPVGPSVDDAVSLALALGLHLQTLHAFNIILAVRLGISLPLRHSSPL